LFAFTPKPLTKADSRIGDLRVFNTQTFRTDPCIIRNIGLRILVSGRDGITDVFNQMGATVGRLVWRRRPVSILKIKYVIIVLALRHA